ncbi:universal stress protein [Natrialbaceae archaeon AArc-T1-2]|uniref:universal stress protein n=1 Tax=Natrialbaceae archaeon AArc-T1-2 TaxID=3053904 RepID=UPI00255ADFE5|nr:universal stress protein [Natrialbaceae archaeon AArc-T1-2]WIV67824.1 universal stress protein [Natrialbaceae archaeon AArc-T1-2]
MYRDVLVPTDGSDAAYQAVEHGIAIADGLDANVHALSVIPGSGTSKRDQLRANPEKDAETAVKEVLEVADQEGVDATGTVRSGVAQEEILAYAREHDVDMIVMGTHGRTGLDHVLMGSVAEEVVKKSSIPVVTVPPSE